MANLQQQQNEQQKDKQVQNETSFTKSFTRNPYLLIQNEIDKAMRNLHTFFDFTSFTPKELNDLKMTPSINIVEDNENFKIEAEMPGMAEEDVKVSINNRKVTLKGEKKISSKDEGKNFYIQEIGYGCYEREIALPDDLGIEQATATFKKGMLWVTIPKKQGAEKQAKQINVEKA